MSINLPLQKLARSSKIYAGFLRNPHFADTNVGPAMPSFTHSVRPRVVLPLHLRSQRRTLFGLWNRKRDITPLDPMTEQFAQRKQKQDQMAQNGPQRGSIGRGSILDEVDGGDGQQKAANETDTTDTSVRHRNPSLMAPVLDPNPKARKAWERKMLIRDLHRQGRINKSTLIARTERQHLSKSPFIKGSIKKLMPLARQIAGKPLDEAMIQMRFSKKKAAVEILRHLERAKNEAIVAKGMGLGQSKAADEVGDANAPELGTPKRMVVQDKKGARRVVTDTTAMYIDQAWIGKGAPDKMLSHRARGRTDLLLKRWTSVTVVLKEEQTRIRQMNERADKEAKKLPWLHLPDRPVTRQTQYPLW